MTAQEVQGIWLLSSLTWYTLREISYSKVLTLPLDLKYFLSGLHTIVITVTRMNLLLSCICEELVFSSCFIIINKLFLTIILKSRTGFFSQLYS